MVALRAFLLVSVLAACSTSPSRRPAPTAGARATDPVALPVVVEHDRFFLVTRTDAGAPLRIYLDSAGGMFLTRAAVQRLGLPTSKARTAEGELETAPLPPLADAAIPRPMTTGGMPVLDEVPFATPVDGMFGAPWFAARTFTFDYAARRLLLRAPGSVPDVAPAHRVAMGLPRDDAGLPTTPYGRIQMTVAGETLDMLFDTGATVDLTPAALRVFGGDARERATSFITQRVFDRWRKAHPAWRVVEDADRSVKGAAMIEVPAVTLGGHTVGPVWFTWRPDKAFHEWMAQWMDKPTEGAIGGSALRHYKRVTADWVNAVVVFER